MALPCPYFRIQSVTLPFKNFMGVPLSVFFGRTDSHYLRIYRQIAIVKYQLLQIIKCDRSAQMA